MSVPSMRAALQGLRMASTAAATRTVVGAPSAHHLIAERLPALRASAANLTHTDILAAQQKELPEHVARIMAGRLYQNNQQHVATNTGTGLRAFHKQDEFNSPEVRATYNTSVHDLGVHIATGHLESALGGGNTADLLVLAVKCRNELKLVARDNMTDKDGAADLNAQRGKGSDAATLVQKYIDKATTAGKEISYGDAVVEALQAVLRTNAGVNDKHPEYFGVIVVCPEGNAEIHATSIDTKKEEEVSTNTPRPGE